MLNSASFRIRCGKFARQLFPHVLIYALLCTASVVTVGQTPQINNASDLTHAPVPGAGHDYQRLLNETVNFSNGSVNLKLAFPMPKGRGIDIPLSWTYSSASVNPLDILDGNTPYWYNPALHSGANPAGWYVFDGIPIGTAQVWSVVGNGYDPLTGVVKTSDTWIPCNFQSGMTFRDSDGVSHDLNIWAEAGANTAGTFETCNDASSFTPITSPPGSDGQVTATLTPNTASAFLASNSPQSGAFIVVDKNGTTYQFGGGVTSSNPGTMLLPGTIEDRNGNKITLTSDSTAPYKDTAGRALYQVESSSSAQSVYTIGGTGNYTADWGTTAVNYPVQFQVGAGTYGGQPIICQSGPTSVGGSRPTLTSLALPNGQQYQFFYGSTNPHDQTILNNYGLINEVIYPDGGWVKYQWTLPPSGVFNALSEVGGKVSLGPVGDQQIAYQQVSAGCFYLYQVPVLSQRTVSFDGTNVAQVQKLTYTTNWTGSSGITTNWLSKSTTVQTQASGKTAQTVYAYLPMNASMQKFAPGSIVPQVPMESTVSYYDWGQSTPNKVVTKTWLDQFRMTSESTQIAATNQISERVYSYGAAQCATSAMTSGFSYLLEEDDWDFGILTSPQQATAPGTMITPPPLPLRQKEPFTSTNASVRIPPALTARLVRERLHIWASQYHRRSRASRSKRGIQSRR